MFYFEIEANRHPCVRVAFFFAVVDASTQTRQKKSLFVAAKGMIVYMENKNDKIYNFVAAWEMCAGSASLSPVTSVNTFCTMECAKHINIKQFLQTFQVSF